MYFLFVKVYPKNIGVSIIFPMATIVTWGNKTKGQAEIPAIVPMLERHIVPPYNYCLVNLAESDNSLRWLSFC